MLDELIELKRVRLEHDWTYHELGVLIGFKNPDATYRLINAKHHPTERTLYKIRRFLDALRVSEALHHQRRAS